MLAPPLHIRLHTTHTHTRSLTRTFCECAERTRVIVQSNAECRSNESAHVVNVVLIGLRLARWFGWLLSVCFCVVTSTASTSSHSRSADDVARFVLICACAACCMCAYTMYNTSSVRACMSACMPTIPALHRINCFTATVTAIGGGDGCGVTMYYTVRGSLQARCVFSVYPAEYEQCARPTSHTHSRIPKHIFERRRCIREPHNRSTSLAHTKSYTRALNMHETYIHISYTTQQRSPKRSTPTTHTHNNRSGDDVDDGCVDIFMLEIFPCVFAHVSRHVGGTDCVHLYYTMRARRLRDRIHQQHSAQNTSHTH